MTDTATLPVVPIENMPYMPPRRGHEGEAIFLTAWQRFAARGPEEFQAIFTDTFRAWTQPQASAAASFVTWLGTNCGDAFLANCERWSRLSESNESGYLAAWAMENRRRRHVNYGLRAVEWILARTTPITEGRFGVLDWRLVAEVTLEELDAIECIVAWLASPQGRVFVEACRLQVKAEQTRLRLFEDGDPTEPASSAPIGQP